MSRLLGHTLILILALFLVGQLLFASTRPKSEPERAVVSLAPGSVGKAHAGFGGETVIERDASGQFQLQARVNGEDTRFIVDTGADIVALTPAEAERLGIDVVADDFAPILQTASGVGRGARIKLDRLELGDEEFRDVGAVVVEGLGVNLLGQSVLRRLGRVELQGDRMVIEHR